MDPIEKRKLIAEIIEISKFKNCNVDTFSAMPDELIIGWHDKLINNPFIKVKTIKLNPEIICPVITDNEELVQKVIRSINSDSVVILRENSEQFLSKEEYDNMYKEDPRDIKLWEDKEKITVSKISRDMIKEIEKRNKTQERADYNKRMK